MLHAIPHTIGTAGNGGDSCPVPYVTNHRSFHAVHNREARELFRLLRAAEDEYGGDVHLSTGFQERTQNVFLPISARLKNMEEATNAIAPTNNF